MKGLAIFTILISAFSISFQNRAEQYDICIYGGTAAGVIAAYTAAKMGKKVILVEPGRHLGGLSSGGLGYTDIGNKSAITGLARDFYRRIGKHYGKFEQWIFEPHVAENLFKEYIKTANIKVVFDFRIKSADKQNGFIKKIVVENSSSPASATDEIIAAKMFIDCSYEGDLMAKAGVSYTVGRESNSEYNERYNGVQFLKGHQFPDGVDPYRKTGDSSSGLLWGISNARLQPNGSRDKNVQAYNYRICLSNNPDNRLPITRPEDYDVTKYELLVRLFNAQPEKRTLNDYFSFSKMPNSKTDVNNRGGFSTDMIGMNHNYPEADYSQRTRIIKSHENYVKGLLYFYCNDPRVPAELRKEMLQWGYPKDEYTTNGHWSPQLYIRESRRMIGNYIITQADCQGKTVVLDEIGMAAYTMDSHNCQRLVVNGMVKNEGNVEIGGFGPYPISYGAIIPKQTDCHNLYVPVCLSASHIAYGSIRMEPVFMVLAQSAATAACMAIDGNLTVHQLDLKKLREQLKNNPLLDGSLPDLLVDNDELTHTTISGKWKRMTSGGNYGPSMLVGEPGGTAENIVTFTPAIPVEGKYTVYIYVPKMPNASTRTIVTVFDGKTSKEVIINNTDIQVEGQTSGEWISLNTYTLPKGKNAYITVSNKQADGVVVADAVLLVQSK